MSTTRLKIPDGFDFTPYIARGGYEPNPDEVTEISSKVASTGYSTRKIGTEKLTTIKVTFAAGMNDTQIQNCISALDVGSQGDFQFWCSKHNRLRKAAFIVEKEAAKLIRPGVYDKWSVTLKQNTVASDVNAITVSKFGSLVNSSDGTWSNPSFIFAEDGNYVATSGGLNTDWDLIVYGFGYTIPSNAIINSVAIGTKYLCQMVAGQNPVGQLSLGIEYKGTKRGTALVTTDLPLVDTHLITWNTGIWTPDQLNSNDCKVYVRVRRKTTSTLVYYFDYISMSVIYTEVG